MIVQVSGVEVADYGPMGLGLKACRDLKQGEEVIVVPKEAMITEETARKSYLGEWQVTWLRDFFLLDFVLRSFYKFTHFY